MFYLKKNNDTQYLTKQYSSPEAMNVIALPFKSLLEGQVGGRHFMISALALSSQEVINHRQLQKVEVSLEQGCETNTQHKWPSQLNWNLKRRG